MVDKLEEMQAEITRLRGLLIDPGSPPWEDARTVLAAELRKAEMPNHARAVERGEGPYIPSHIALNLIAHATLFTPTEDARSRVKVLEEALEAIRDGDVPRPVHCQWRTDGKPSKLDECKHGVTMSEDCAGCTAEFVTAALGNKETDRHG